MCSSGFPEISQDLWKQFSSNFYSFEHIDLKCYRNPQLSSTNVSHMKSSISIHQESEKEKRTGTYSLEQEQQLKPQYTLSSRT